MLTVVLERRLKSLEDDVLGFSWETIRRVDNSVRSFLEEDTYLAREIIEKKPMRSIRKAIKLNTDVLRFWGCTNHWPRICVWEQHSYEHP